MSPNFLIYLTNLSQKNTLYWHQIIRTMKFYFLFVAVAVTFLPFNAFSQSLTGDWKTIDDQTGAVKSIITISEVDGKFFGHVKEILDEEFKDQQDVLCEPCPGDKKNTPVVGLEIIWDMEKTKKNKWSEGKIMDPENGKIYGCQITFENPEKLKVRGFIGFAALGRNQYWHRVK